MTPSAIPVTRTLAWAIGAWSAFLITVLALAMVACQPDGPAELQQVDTLILGAKVFSGEDGDTGAVADVALTNGKILAVGDLSQMREGAAQIIDAGGMILAPGFIDPHTHAGDDLLDPTLSINTIHQ